MIREYRVEIIGSILLHLLLGGVLAASPSCLPKSEKKEKVTMIKAVSLATVKKSNLPNRASKAPRESSPPQKTEPKVNTPKPPEVKTKPEQMVLKKEEKKEDKEPKEEKKTEPKKEEPKKETKPEKESNKQSREELMRKLAKEEAIKSLENAPDGPVDREATSQDGSEKSTSGSSSVGPTDPVLSAYVEASRNAILPNWTPLPSIIAEHPEYEVVLKVEVMEDGTMKNPKIIKKSGDSSFDRAAIMAIHKTIKIPPPPEKWRNSAKSGIIITLAAQDK